MRRPRLRSRKAEAKALERCCRRSVRTPPSNRSMPAPTPRAALETCFFAQHRQAVVDAVASQYGAVTPSADKGVLKCQQAIGSAAAGHLVAHLRASQKCLVRRNKAGAAVDGAALCVGALAANTFAPPLDPKTAAAATRAATKLALKIEAKCTDEQLRCARDLRQRSSHRAGLPAVRPAHGDIRPDQRRVRRPMKTQQRVIPVKNHAMCPLLVGRSEPRCRPRSGPAPGSVLGLDFGRCAAEF